VIGNVKSSSSIMNNCVKTIFSIVHNWNIIYTLFPTDTEPYWRCAGDSDRNALNMGYIYEQLIALLTNGANSPTLLTTNRLQLVIGPQLELGKVSQSLFEKSSLETFQAHYSRIIMSTQTFIIILFNCLMLTFYRISLVSKTMVECPMHYFILM
jgi:hypothetical protein